MSDIDSFLNITVPNVLRTLQKDYSFMIVGGRALNAYLPDNPIPTIDWDIVFIGDEKGQNNFAKQIKQAFADQEYTISLEHKAPNYNSNNDSSSSFSFRSRPWIRLYVDIGDETKLTLIDLYYMSQASFKLSGVVIMQDGLLYSDLGFLLRELNRAEYDTVKHVNLTSKQITEKLQLSQNLLNETENHLDLVEQEIDDIVEELGQESDNNIRAHLQEQISHLEKAKHNLIRIVKEREALFGVVRKGQAPKMIIDQVCQVCRSLETQYTKFTDLQKQCQEINRTSC